MMIVDNLVLVRAARIVVAAAILCGVVGLVAMAAPAPIITPAEKPTDEEAKALAWMHRNTVEIFIDRPGFGIRRMVLPLEDVVKSPKTPSKKDAEGKDPPARDSISPPEAEKSVKKQHYEVQDVLGDGAGNPLGRPTRILTDDKKEEWKVRKVQLVGLVKHKDPVVYVTEKMKEMKETKEVPTRALDAFEKRGLEVIRGGDNLKAEKRDKEMRVMGPLYAGQRCVTCHATKGELLGAFSYVLERVPLEAEKEAQPTGPRLP
jgi:hypothetical protein